MVTLSTNGIVTICVVYLMWTDDLESLMPHNLTEKDCFVDNWERLICSWRRDYQESEVRTVLRTYTFCRDEMHSNQNVTCQRKGSELKCELKVMMIEYGIQVCAQKKTVESINRSMNKSISEQIKCSDTICINLDERVKPSPIKNVSEMGSTSRWVELKIYWKRGGVKVMFIIEIENARRETTLIKTNSTEVRLDDLRPNAIYSVKVKCIPLVRVNVESYVEMGNFSDPYSFNLKTHPDVPDENPQLLPGSFYFDSSTSSDGKTYVNIFWRKIPEESENGLLNHTGITYWEMGRDGDVRRENCDPNEVTTQLKWQMDRRKDYTVEVVISNEKGVNNNIPPSRIFIPSLKRAPKSPEHVYATLVNNSIQLKWSELKEIVGYTVYWCSLHHSTRKCHSNQNIEWKSDIPAETTELIIPVTSNDLDLKVGISVEKFDSDMNRIVSSGVTWSQCINKLVADVLPPTHFHFSPQQTPHSLTIMWSHPECSDTSYISGYEIFWCKQINNDDDVDNFFRCNSTEVSSSVTSWTLHDLDLSSNYRVKMRSISFAISSDFTDVMNYEKRPKGLPSEVSKVLVIATLVVTFIVIIIITCAVCVIKTYKRETSIVIVLPPSTNQNPYYAVTCDS